jgi:hypothetical protein
MSLSLWLLVTASFLQQGQPTEIVVKSEVPAYEVRLPAGFEHTEPKEFPRRYVHFCGRSMWENVSAVLASGEGPLAQNPAGITLEDIRPFLNLPPDSKTLFYTMKWNTLDVGVVEYRAVEKNLPMVGLCIVLPLQDKALTLTVSAPTPLEKEMRADFKELLSRIGGTKVNWYTAEELGTMKTMDLIGKAGAAVLLLYPVGWALFFRGDPMRGHWVRVAWLMAAAVLLFLPTTSPGPTTALNNLVVNAVLPTLIVSLVVRRVKMGIDEG